MQKRYTSFRVNPLKDKGEALEEIKKHNLKIRKAGIYENAYILENAKEEDLESLDCYREGGIYLQSLSSMMPPLKMDLIPGHAVLEYGGCTRWKNNRNGRLKYE